MFYAKTHENKEAKCPRYLNQLYLLLVIRATICVSKYVHSIYLNLYLMLQEALLLKFKFNI